MTVYILCTGHCYFDVMTGDWREEADTNSIKVYTSKAEADTACEELNERLEDEDDTTYGAWVIEWEVL